MAKKVTFTVLICLAYLLMFALVIIFSGSGAQFIYEGF